MYSPVTRDWVATNIDRIKNSIYSILFIRFAIPIYTILMNGSLFIKVYHEFLFISQKFNTLISLIGNPNPKVAKYHDPIPTFQQHLNLKFITLVSSFNDPILLCFS